MHFKKVVIAILSFFLLVSNIGFAVIVHYCNNEVASISVNTTINKQEVEKDCCGNLQEESSCCNNKVIKSVEKSDQIVSKLFSLDANYYLTLWTKKSTDFVAFKSLHKVVLFSYWYQANEPPLYLLYSQYTFYA